MALTYHGYQGCRTGIHYLDTGVDFEVKRHGQVRRTVADHLCRCSGIGQMEHKARARVDVAVFRRDAGYEIMADAYWSGNRNQCLGSLAFVDQIDNLPGFLDRPPREAGKRIGRIGRDDSGRQALKQRRAEFFLQSADLPAYGRSSNVKLPGRAVDRPALKDRKEVAQGRIVKWHPANL